MSKVIEFSKEQAQQALKDLRLGRLKDVRHFLECVERYLPSREDYKSRKAEETSKQKRRKLELKKEIKRGKTSKEKTRN